MLTAFRDVTNRVTPVERKKGAPVFSLEDYGSLTAFASGSFGIVYKGTVKRNQRAHDGKNEVVLKKVDLTGRSQCEQEKAVDECRILQSINSCYTTSFYGAFLHQESLYMVMEYCDGGTLKNCLLGFKQREELLEENTIWLYFIQLSLGLGHIHSKGILHRDVKCENVFLSTQHGGIAKIGDFGSSKILQSSAVMTRTYAGTPAYMSPELCMHRPYNDKSDIWGLGVILFEMCSLRQPYYAKTREALSFKILRQKTPPLPPSYSEEIGVLVEKLLSKDCNERPTVAEMLNDDVVARKAKTMRKFLPKDDSTPHIRVHIPEPSQHVFEFEAEDDSDESSEPSEHVGAWMWQSTLATVGVEPPKHKRPVIVLGIAQRAKTGNKLAMAFAGDKDDNNDEDDEDDYAYEYEYSHSSDDGQGEGGGFFKRKMLFWKTKRERASRSPATERKGQYTGTKVKNMQLKEKREKGKKENVAKQKDSNTLHPPGKKKKKKQKQNISKMKSTTKKKKKKTRSREQTPRTPCWVESVNKTTNFGKTRKVTDSEIQQEVKQRKQRNKQRKLAIEVLGHERFHEVYDRVARIYRKTAQERQATPATPQASRPSSADEYSDYARGYSSDYGGYSSSYHSDYSEYSNYSNYSNYSEYTHCYTSQYSRSPGDSIPPSPLGAITNGSLHHNEPTPAPHDSTLSPANKTGSPATPIASDTPEVSSQILSETPDISSPSDRVEETPDLSDVTSRHLSPSPDLTPSPRPSSETSRNALLAQYVAKMEKGEASAVRRVCKVYELDLKLGTTRALL